MVIFSNSRVVAFAKENEFANAGIVISLLAKQFNGILYNYSRSCQGLRVATPTCEEKGSEI